MQIRPYSFIAIASTLTAAVSVALAAPQQNAPKADPAKPVAPATAPPVPAAKPDTKPEAKPEAKPVDIAPADLPEAKTIVAKHIDALGGRAKLDAVQSSRYKAALASPMGPVTIEFAAKKPAMFKMKQSLPGMGESEMGSDGKLAWMSNPQTKKFELADDAMKAQMMDGADLQGLVRSIDTRFAKLTTTGKKDFNGASCWTLTMQDKEGPEMTGYFDATTGLIAGLEQSGNGPQGQMTQVTKITDWADIDGVKVFKVMTTDVMGMSMKMEFTDLEFNKLDDAYFAAPQEVKDLAAAKPAVAPAAPGAPAAPAAPTAPAAPKTDAPKDAPKTDAPKTGAPK